MTEILLALAIYHAPIIYQQTGHTPKADAILRVDFDGDFVSNNNWNNLEKYPAEAFTYYDVIESETHFFISYAFFHARDYSNVCIPKVCHENDMEGALLVIEKDGSTYGQLKAIQTLAHNKIYTYLTPKMMAVDPQFDISSRSERPVLFIESGGHGVFAFDPEKMSKYTVDSFGDTTPANPNDVSVATDAIKYFVYTVGLEAQDPMAKDEGKFHYQLLSTNTELWIRRNEIGRGRLFDANFSYGGTRFNLGGIPKGFAGEKWTAGSANPPWAWFDDRRSDVKRGDWFLDPAYFVRRTLNKNQIPTPTSDFSTNYVYHPYLPN